MRVFNKEKTRELYSYDLEKGYLMADKILVKHHPAISKNLGKYHYVVDKVYPNGGKDMRKVWDIQPTEAREAYDEYEEIQVYIPYTQKELAKREINELKQKLRDTDYQAIKYAEGRLSAQEYEPMGAQREQWRIRINELKKL